MLTFQSSRQYRDCEGASRRDFFRVGALGAGALTLPQLLEAKSHASAAGRSIKNKSVIWIWLAGGPTHVETFDPKMTAPVEYRSVTGEVQTSVPGMTLGGSFLQMAKLGDKLSVVRSFAHGSSSHGTGTRWVMTGVKPIGQESGKPSIGSIVSKLGGTFSPETGMPTYLRMGTIGGDGAGYLGPQYSPFSPSGQAAKNMNVSLPVERVSDRRQLLGQLDQIDRDIDRTGKVRGIDGYEEQAFNLMLGQAKDAFGTKGEDQKTRDRYGRGFGENLLSARRLCEAGASFVTVSSGGWDMHGSIERNMKGRAPALDQGVSALIEDLHDRGMQDDVLVVVTGDFGRTPRINKNAGRDHWGNLCTLALSGGGLNMGQVVGRSSAKAEVPDSSPIRPHDLVATIFELFGIPLKQQVVDFQGRPMYLLEDGTPIQELI
ncbi:MAG: DUF1501 domain-containing protein [Planctomycetota bacterium]|nr:DUF1501 domain-containing protein [Planctomycetota bacterium]MDA1166099.1 DUF1501 domain-containing protein [Planctomycetota bacterium]